MTARSIVPGSEPLTPLLSAKDGLQMFMTAQGSAWPQTAYPFAFYEGRPANINDCAGLVPGSEPLAPLRIAELSTYLSVLLLLGATVEVAKYQEWVQTRLRGRG